MKIRAIITGTTGMVGEGVLHECLLHTDVESVLVINRRPCGVQHPKLTEIIHADFTSFAGMDKQLSGYNAAFFCMGVTSVGKKEDEYRRLTYDLTMALARPLARLNPDMSIAYVSGVGTDSTEQGRTMWARVKGKTENDLMALPFRQAFMFRPGYIQPTPGLQRSYKVLKYIAPFYPVLKFLAPQYVCTLKEIGLAMINSALGGYEQQIIEVKDIIQLAARAHV